MLNNRYYIVGAVVLIIGIFSWVALSGEKETPIEVASPNAEVLYQRAVKLKGDQEWIKAKEVYQRIFAEHPDFEKIEVVQKELEGLNMKIIFSNISTDQTVMHEVASGDTLGELASRYKTTVDLIKISNNLKNDVIRIGQKIRVWTGTFNILIDKSQNILILKDDNDVLKVYRVSTGEQSSTPVGTYMITTKLIDPVWFNRGVVVPPESPENVLGSRWLGFDLPGYGIHGTVDPETIGQQVTAGCVRMKNPEVEELYTLIPTGTQVTIIN